MHIGHDHGMGGTAVSENDKAVCPVMNMDVSKKESAAQGLVRTHDGQGIYLCCDHCATDFDKEPEKYVIKETHEG